MTLDSAEHDDYDDLFGDGGQERDSAAKDKEDYDDLSDDDGGGSDRSGGGSGESGGPPLYVRTITVLPTVTTSAFQPTMSATTQPHLPSPPVTTPTMPATMSPPMPTPTLAPPITSTTKLSSETPVVPTTTNGTQVPLQPGSLLCTIGQGFKRATYTFPPDGLCTIITFDSLYRKRASLAPPYAKDFEYFLKRAKKAKQSEFGIGIHKSIIANATAATQFVSNPFTKKYLDELWDEYGVYHYALVAESSAHPGYHSVYVATVAKALAMVSALMSDRKNPLFRPSYTMLYFWVPSSIAVKIMAQRLANETSLDVFVFMGYFRYANINFMECLMLPPAFLPSALAGASSSRTYKENLACLQPTYNSSFYLDTTFEALVAFDVKEEIIFTYDSASNLRSKICRAKKSATNVTNLMAAVDIQFEDYNNTCGHGSYPRLHALKQLSAFLSSTYTSPDKEAECLATS
ncbi:hypothetical protein MTO96_034560 [Rhipicephalus appendiculatus]